MQNRQYVSSDDVVTNVLNVEVSSLCLGKRIILTILLLPVSLINIDYSP